MVNSHVPPSEHLFSFETATGDYAPMHTSWFLNRCNEVWSGKGLSTLSGHSFRIGGTTQLLLLGINPSSLWHKATGGLQPSWIIGDCVGLSLLLLVSP